MPAATTPAIRWLTSAVSFSSTWCHPASAGPGVTGIIGNGVVVNPEVLLGEMAGLQERGIDTSRLFVSDRAHVIMPYHILLDALQEQERGREAIGTTGQGIGPGLR